MKKDWKFRHLAFVVKDIDKAIQYYESLGIVSAVGSESFMEWPNKAKSNYRFIQIGSLVIEFYQPVEGKSIHSDFLEKHGEGIQRIAFAVDDIDKELDELVSRGVTLMFRQDMPNGTRMAYVDTGKVGDILMALVQPTVGVETLFNNQ
jgi:methylmalonyl-CoA/ethylmalonyl-CoA epimerase